MKAAKAYDEGFMDDLLVPCAGVYRDNNLRTDIDVAKLADAEERLREVLARHADRRQTPPRSPMARRACCWRPKSGPTGTD